KSHGECRASGAGARTIHVIALPTITALTHLVRFAERGFLFLKSNERPAHSDPVRGAAHAPARLLGARDRLVREPVRDIRVPISHAVPHGARSSARGRGMG